MNARMIAELHEAAEALAKDAAVRGVVLAAEGRSFCAGGDLNWMREQAGQGSRRQDGGGARARRHAGRLEQLPKLVVARVQGPAYGGGLGLISVADVAIAADGVELLR